MSSPVTTFQNLPMTAQPPVPATITVTGAPPELTALPTGTVLPGVITPPQTPMDLPVITVTLPDGSEVSFPVKLPHVPGTQTPVSLKIMPQEGKDLLSLKIHFTAPLPNIKEAAQALESIIKPEKAVIEPQNKPVTAQAFVLRSVPEQITALLAEITGTEQSRLPPDVKIGIEISPDHNALPALGKQETPVVLPTVQNTPMPSRPVEEVVKVIELPKETPSAIRQSVGTEPKPQLPLVQTPPFEKQTVSSATVTSPSIGTQTATVLLTKTVPTPTPTLQLSPVAANVLEPPSVVPGETEQSLVEINPNVKTNIVPQKTKTELFETIKTVLKKTDVPDVARPETKPADPARLPQQGTTVKGVVFIPEKNAPPLIATKIGVLAVEEKIGLPHLTPVMVKVVSLPALPSFTTYLEQDPLPAFKNTWTVLTHALETLKQTDEAAFEAVKNILPQTGNKLPSLMMSFMHAATQGTSFSAFIGEANVSALQNMGEKGDRLLKRLEKEFSASPKKATDGQNSWKGWDIPLLSGSIVEPVSLFLQRPPEDSGLGRKGTQAKPNGIRFVLDLNLTNLGKIQMEGFARRQERMFDLVVRHQNDLPSSFDPHIHSIFTQTLSALNYAGTVKIDQTDDFIIFTAEEGNGPKRGVLV